MTKPTRPLNSAIEKLSATSRRTSDEAFRIPPNPSVRPSAGTVAPRTFARYWDCVVLDKGRVRL
jgi:hypothetical protein